MQLPPVVFENLPTPHALHCPPSGPWYPGLHLQLVIAVLPATEVLLPGQLSQANGPPAVLNFPVSQAVHGPPFGPVNPGRHEQFNWELLPTGEVLFAGH
jgi:hypothetical protein